MTMTHADLDCYDELDDDAQLANFCDWLPNNTFREETLAEVLASLNQPFSTKYPDGDHCFGVAFSSDSEEITRLANNAMALMHRRYSSTPYADKDKLPNLAYWFHQSGSDQPTGWQYWELLGSTSALGMYVCDELCSWLPRQIAYLLDRDRGKL